jgi:hypothetical protein
MKGGKEERKGGKEERRKGGKEERRKGGKEERRKGGKEERRREARELRVGLRARPRYPGVGDGTRRTTFPRATHPYLSMLLHSYLVR